MRPYSTLLALGERLVEAVHRRHREERHEQLLEEQRALQRQLGDRRRHEVALVEHLAPEPLAAEQDLALPTGLGHRLLPPLHRPLVDHRPEPDIALGHVAHPDGPGLLDQLLDERPRPPRGARTPGWWRCTSGSAARTPSASPLRRRHRGRRCPSRWRRSCRPAPSGRASPTSATGRGRSASRPAWSR